MVRLLIGLLCATSVWAASPTTCYAVASGNWTSPAIWASTAGGAGGSCGASGGAALTVEGQTATLDAGVPGASGLKDHPVINTGITVHIPAGVGIDAGKGDVHPANGNGLVINATDATTYGMLIVDAHALVYLRGTSSSAGNNYAIIAQYAVLQIAPGGHLRMSGVNAPSVLVSGRLYVGCGDQSLYPSPACAGNAGTWVTTAAGSTLNITAVSVLPSVIAAGDLVELDRVPQRPTHSTFPYAVSDEVLARNPPPAIPTMPTSTDTGTSPMRTCGSAADCLIPESTLLCVVAISGNSVSLGWPQGGNPAEPYCTGAETAIPISAAGRGRLWLKKPAFLWGPPSNFTWATSRSATASGYAGTQFDGVRSAYFLAQQPLPMSNVARTGPGRKGDVDFTFNSGDLGPCSLNSVPDVHGSGCHIDYETGAIFTAGNNVSITTNISYYSAANVPTATGAQSISIPAGTRTHNELVIENADLRYMVPGANSLTSTGVIQYAVLPNTANNRAAFRFNTVRMACNVVGINAINPSASNPLEITENSFFPACNPNDTGGIVMSHVASSANVDISHNYARTGAYWPYSCNLGSAATSAIQLTNYAITNNYVQGGTLLNLDNACDTPGLRLQQNRIVSYGGNGSVGPGYQFAIKVPFSSNPASPVVIRNNYQYGAFRFAQIGSNVDLHHNYLAFNYHHTIVMGRSFYVTNPGSLVQNAKVHDNVIVTYPGVLQTLTISCIETNYNQASLIEGVRLYNNTCLGHAGPALMQGDISDSTIGLLPDFRAYDNAAAPYTGAAAFGKWQGLTAQSPGMTQTQVTFAGHNAAQGANPMYDGVDAANVNNIPNPEYNRHILVTRSGVNYNTDGTRQVLGVALQNPSYATNQTGSALRLTVTSGSNMSLAWALNGSTYGAETQLNWGGAGTTYTVATVTDPGAINAHMQITVSGTPFVAMENSMSGGAILSTSCPVGRWAKVVTAAGTIPVGTAFAIVRCTGTAGAATNALTLIPRDTRLTTGDTFVILASEARLVDNATTNYVDAGIDARVLPGSTVSDSGIALTLTDYCASGCSAASVLDGLPTGFTTGNLPLAWVPLPELGGAAEHAFSGWRYAPTTRAWQTASSTGSYIGAVPPPLNQTVGAQGLHLGVE